jgi:hypothetical protein
VSRFCRCGTALARDNTSRLCSACQATRQRGRPPDVPPEFWEAEVMASALDSGDLGWVLRAYRCHPFHGQHLPQALVAGWLHMSQAAVCRIEKGRRRVTMDEIAQIASALAMPVTLPRACTSTSLGRWSSGTDMRRRVACSWRRSNWLRRS